MQASLEELEARLQYRFANRDLLLRALTHKSKLAETPATEGAAVPSDNEQLEFLGDSILGFLASEYLLKLNPTFPEGHLSKLKAYLVSATHLHESAQILELGRYLTLGRGEELSGGREKKAILADAVEALIAAMYLDGGLGVCHDFLARYVWGNLNLEDFGPALIPVDSKSALQELAQSRHLPMPRYTIVRESGPEHAKTFTVEARIGREFAAQAIGSSKKAAGQQAACQLLDVLRAAEAVQAGE